MNLFPEKWRLDERQIKIFFILNLVFLPIAFIFGLQGVPALLAATAAFVLIALGRRIYEEETSETWLDFSVFKSARNAFGAFLIFTGWMVFVRGVLTVAVASLLLWLG